MAFVTDPPTDLTPLVLTGHVIDVLRTLPARSVQMVVTSPPYWGLRAYGTPPQTWGGSPECIHTWTRTPPRRERAADDAGGGPIQQGNTGASYEAQGGEACGCGAWRGELGLEPTPEMFIDHLSLVAAEIWRVLRDDGTFWMDIGDTYIAHPAGLTGPARWAASTLANAASADHTGAEQAGSFDKRGSGLKEKDLALIPFRAALRLQSDGWYVRSDIIWAKRNPMPSSAKDRPTHSHEYIFLLTKSPRYFYDPDGVRRRVADSTAARAESHLSNPDDNPETDSKWGSGSFHSYPVLGRIVAAATGPAPGYTQSTLREIEAGYAGRAVKDYSGTGAQDPSAVKARIIAGARAKLDAGLELWANLKSVWWINTQPYPDAHFATFPEAIPETCIRAGTSERGACAQCGAPWSRAGPVPYTFISPPSASSPRAGENKPHGQPDSLTESAATHVGGWNYYPMALRHPRSVWAPTCTCYADPCPKCGAPWATESVSKVTSTTNVMVRDAKNGTLELKSGYGGRAHVSEEAKTTCGPEGFRQEVVNVRHPACSCQVVPCVVMDPFAGSGTTLQVARRLGRRSIGVELKADYSEMARNRAGSRIHDIESFGEPDGQSQSTVG